MKAIDVLMEEHRLIEQVLDAVESAAGSLERGAAVRAGLFLEAAEFLAGFADGCHHHKEEGVLFPAMIESGMPPHGGPIAVMLHEHEQGRAYIRAIREQATRLGGGDREAIRSLVANVRGYVALLRDHIVKEDQVLFPMAGQVLAPARMARVEVDFDRVEREEMGAGAHERYHALAERLVAEAAASAS